MQELIELVYIEKRLESVRNNVEHARQAVIARIHSDMKNAYKLANIKYEYVED